MASIDAFFNVGLFDAGYRHFHLDDCWADLERNASGFLQAERDHFPRGLKPVVDYAHKRGLVFGLYTCAGTYTCVGKRPGSKDHWTQDAEVFAEWGIDWVKMDWCNTKGMDPAQTYPLMASALNKTGRHIHFNMCEWGYHAPWEWGPTIAQSWRATGDHTGTWASTKSIIEQRAAIPAELGGAPYAWNDMDMLESGNYAQAAHANMQEGNMTATEYKTEFSMWAIFASPLVVTTPLLNCSTGTCAASITDLQKEILLNTDVIAINQDTTLAGRLLSPASMKEPGVKVFGRRLSDGSWAVAFYNPEDKDQAGYVEFTLLGLAANADASVRDLWLHDDRGVFRGRFPAPGHSVLVEAHGTTVLRITPRGHDAIWA